MDPDKKLEEKFATYQSLAEEDKNIDVASLMLSDIQNQNKNLVSSRMKKWAYLVSIGLPPFGLLFALKLYFGDQEDAKSVANVCVALTVISVAIIYFMGKMLLSGSGASLEQIQQIKPEDIKQLYQ